MMTVLEKVDFLQNARIFRGIRTESLARIAAIAEEVRFEARQLLFSENEPGDAMFVLLEGDVTLARAGGEERKSGAFQVAGAAAVLAEHAQTETARASRPTRALRIGQQDLYDAMAEDINITRGILRALASMTSPLL